MWQRDSHNRGAFLWHTFAQGSVASSSPTISPSGPSIKVWKERGRLDERGIVGTRYCWQMRKNRIVASERVELDDVRRYSVSSG